MSRAPATALAVLAACAALVAGCGESEEELHVEEGHELVLEDVRYQVEISRFINPHDPEDEAYVQGVEQTEDTIYLGVFMVVENEGETTKTIPQDMAIVDTAGEEFEPVSTESPFALELGSTIAPGEEVPGPGTPAATGPIGGGLVLFEIDEQTPENRPLELEIPGRGGETGHVELDI